MLVDRTMNILRRCVVPCLCALGLLALSSGANAQISRPGAHHSYAMELEPHLVVQWEKEPQCGDEGFGLGGRLSFPVIDNGPVPSINNTLAIGVGLDFAYFDGECFGTWRGVRARWNDGSGTSLWVPVVAQWNFFFAESFSAFTELGLAINRQAWEWCDGGGCASQSDIDVDPVLWFGGRVHASDAIAFTFRLGYPSLLLGASFFL